MLTVIAHVPDSFAISFDKKHVRVIDAMAVEERKNLDVNYKNVITISGYLLFLSFLIARSLICRTLSLVRFISSPISSRVC